MVEYGREREAELAIPERYWTEDHKVWSMGVYPVAISKGKQRREELM